MDKDLFRVYVTEPIPGIEEGLKALEGFAHVYVNYAVSEAVPPGALHDFDAVIAGETRITEASLEGAERLKVIGRCGTGCSNIDLEACRRSGIKVFNVPGHNHQSVAEHVIGLMVALSKDFLRLDKLVRSGRWEEKISTTGYELWHKTLGVVGFGNIGKSVARVASSGFEMRVLYYDPCVSEGGRAKRCTLEELLKNSDYVCVCCPLTQETLHMIGRPQIALMKKDAFLISVTGGVVDEDALYEALKDRRLAGAGIDALEDEPIRSHPLFKCDNVMITPHSAAWTAEALGRVATKCCEEIKSVIEGEEPENRVA